MKIVSEITVVFRMCELPWERERKGEEAEKDRDNREDTLRAAMDAKLLWDFKFLIFFLGIFFLFGQMRFILWFEGEGRNPTVKISRSISHTCR